MNFIQVGTNISNIMYDLDINYAVPTLFLNEELVIS